MVPGAETESDALNGSVEATVSDASPSSALRYAMTSVRTATLVCSSSSRPAVAPVRSETVRELRSEGKR